MATKFSNMSIEQRRNYKQDWYNRNKEKVMIARLAKGLETGKRKVKASTLEKYGISPDENNEIVIQPKVNVVFNKERDTEIKAVVRKPKRITDYVPSDTLTSVEIQRWVDNDFKYQQKSIKTEDPRSNKRLREYHNYGKTLFKMHGMEYEPETDISDFFNDANDIIDTINQQKTKEGELWKDSTKQANLVLMLQMYQSFPLVKKVMSKETYEKLDKQANIWKAQGKSRVAEKTRTTLVFSYDVIKRAIKDKYNYLSEENLLFSLYDEVIMRDDGGSLRMAYKQSDMTDDKTNYLLLLRPARDFGTATLYMNQYKTQSTYSQSVFKLSTPLFNLIDALFPSTNIKKLFPFEGEKLSPYIIKRLQAIDTFKNEEGLGTKYLRHSIISTKLLKLKKDDPNYIEKTLKIASQAMHSGETQPRYVSPLKSKNGKALKSITDADEIDELIVKSKDDNKHDKTLIGKTFIRKFKTGDFEGKVMSYTVPFYNIRYEDGDSEEFTEAELKKILKRK